MWLLLSRELSEVAFALNIGVQGRRLGEALLGRRHADLSTEAVSRTVLSSFAPAVLAFLAALALMAQSSSTIVSDTIQTNANRIPRGKLENGVLTLHLELREGVPRSGN
jgi:hypothetical protein